MGNRQFDLSHTARDDCLAAFRHLRERFATVGIDLSTQDINPPESAEFVIFNELPRDAQVMRSCDHNHLILMESPIVAPWEWDPSVHAQFEKVFTWHDGLIDGNKYIKVNYSFEMPTNRAHDSDTDVKRTELFTMIAANKMNRHPLELYSERLRTIEWFENTHPEEFYLYGIGWDKRHFMAPFSYLNRFTGLTGALAPARPSWFGAVTSKGDVMKKSVYSFCYENAMDIPGYITEKMHDSLLSGCIPIYRGAGNVCDYVPSEAFIDRRSFDTIEQLHSHLVEMPERVRMEIRDAGAEFLRSAKAEQFHAGHFAKTICDAVLETMLADGRIG